MADVSYARTGSGWVNGSTLDFGTLYRWNTANDECVFLDDLPFKETDYTPPRPFEAVSNSADLNVTDPKSVSLTVSPALTSLQQAQAQAAVSSRIKFALKNYNTVVIRNTKTRMSEQFADAATDTSKWDILEAMSPKSPLRYVVVYKGKAAEAMTLETARSTTGDASIDLSVVKAGLKAEIKNEASASFTGKEPPALINVYVYRAFSKPGGIADFKDETGALEARFMQRALAGGKCN